MRGVMKSMTDLGLMVYTIRSRAGLSQASLAETLGVSQRWLSELETGKPKVLNDKFLDVLTQLGIELNFSTQADHG